MFTVFFENQLWFVWVAIMGAEEVSSMVLTKIPAAAGRVAALPCARPTGQKEVHYSNFRIR